MSSKAIVDMNILTKLPKPFFVLAPMDDVTDVVFRQIVTDCARPDLFFTEFVNVDGLCSQGREKLLPKLRLDNRQRPIFAQLWGKDPEHYFKVARELVQMGYDGVDINMGCPDKAVVKNGCCIALINNRSLAGEIITAVREGVGPHFPVSVKTRLGLNTIDLSWHEYLLEYKLNMLTIHGRTAFERSVVPAQWDMIGEIRKLRDVLSPAISIVGNGDVNSRAEGETWAQKYGVDGVMIGRGVFDDPFVFAAKSPWANMSKAERIALYRHHVELFARTWHGGERKLHTLNKFCKVYINGFDGAKELREHLMQAKSADELLDLLR